MTKDSHLWAIGYDNIGRANQVRDEVTKLGWGTHSYLHLTDVAVVERQPDGSFTFNREPFPAVRNILSCAAVGFLAGLVLAAPPLTGTAVGALLGVAGSAAVSFSVGIGKDFVREVEEMMKPGTSALFVLDREGNMEATLNGIRGLGGKVLKTNVDLERAELIQSTLAASADTRR
jgi:uncharacterized membrane protein